MELSDLNILSTKHPLTKHRWSLGQRAADKLTKFAGSWTFIFLLFLLLAIWMAVNVLMVVYRWDPYPFILLNLILSCLAAVHAPIILMSQNRQAQRDRIKAEFDYRINKKSEKGIRELKKNIEELKKIIKKKK